MEWSVNHAVVLRNGIRLIAGGSAEPVGIHDMISSLPSTLPQFLSGIVHFLAISCVARYNAFRSAVSLGNTLLCFFSGRPFPTLMVTPVFRSLFSPRSYIKKKPQTALQSRS